MEGDELYHGWTSWGGAIEAHLFSLFSFRAVFLFDATYS